MIKPPEIDEVVWEVIKASAEGDVETLRRLLAVDPGKRSRNGYFYTPPIHYAVREGHLEVVKMLLDAGADSEWDAHYGLSLIELARERDYEDVARLLEKTRDSRGRVAQSPTREDHEIHRAAGGDLQRVRALLDADPSLLDRGDRAGGTPLHRAVVGRAQKVVAFLLDRGANIHAIHGVGLGASGGFGAQDVQAIDLAIWGGFGRRPRPPLRRIVIGVLKYWLWYRHTRKGPRPCDEDMARLLIRRGAQYDLTIAAALGDLAAVRSMLDKDPSRIRELRPNARRPLLTAIEFGHEDIARLLLERGADPTWSDLNADRGGSLWEAARVGNLPLVELLLQHGADPNGHTDSGGNAVYAAKTKEIRALLEAHGGTLDPFDLVWKDEDDQVMRRVMADPKSAELGCGGVFTAVVTRGKRDLLKRLLDAGVRVPRYVTGCQSYLMEHPDMLQALLNNGMHPDTCNWQQQTMLHMLCRIDPGGRERERNIQCAGMLLAAGANISARDEDISATPLGWAARNNNVPMVKFLLSHGAPTNLPDDKPWATPLAWATRKGNTEIVQILRGAGTKA